MGDGQLRLEAHLPDELPEGWITAPMGEVCFLNPRKPAPDRLPATAPVTFVPMPAVDAASGTIAIPQQRAYGEVRGGYTGFEEGDVIVAKITPCMENGKAAVARGLLNGLAFGSSEFHVLRPNGAALADYLYHYVRQPVFREAAEQEMTGSVGQRRVPADFLATALVPLAPLSEQTRIVVAVEALLQRVEAVRQRLARVLEIMKQFRRIVLSAASSGALTADWRCEQVNLRTASEWVSTCGNGGGSPVTVDDAPSGWCQIPLSAITRCLDARRIPVSAVARNKRLGSIPYYGANGQVGWIDEPLFDEDLVLVVEDETFVGRSKPFSYVVRGKSWVNNHAHVLRPLGGMSADYLNVILSHYDFVPLTSGSTGRKKLTQAALMQAPFLIAGPDEQAEIVRRVDALFALADRVEQRVAAAQARADRLTQAILSRAFRGELVPTEAELARQERREYEPASVLLERVRAERNEGGAASNGKRTPTIRRKNGRGGKLLV